MIAPIPRALLPHSATLYKRTGVDENNKATFADGVTLENVRFDGTRKRTVGKLGEEVSNRLLMTFDCVNSMPSEAEFAEQDEIDFGGTRFVVSAVTPEYTVYGYPHHYEVLLA